MVSGFFGGGAAAGFARQRALDVQEAQVGLGADRLEILRQQLQQRATEGQQERLVRERKVIQDRIEKIQTASGLPNSPITPSVARELIQKDLQSLSTINRMLGGDPGGTVAINEALIGIPKFEEARTVTSRTPTGDVRTQIFRGERPVADVGTGPSVQFQPQEAPKATSKEAAALDDAEVAVRNVMTTGFDLIDTIKTAGPQALGVAGDISLGIENVRSAAEGIAQVLGVDIKKFEDGTAVLNADRKAESVFQRMGVAATLNAQVKSSIVNLAFAAAAASGQSGRSVSDKDFERFVRELGAGAKKPETFVRVLEKFMERINANFQNRFTVAKRRRRDLSGAPTPDILGEIRSQRQTRQPASPAEMSDDELKTRLGIP